MQWPPQLLELLSYKVFRRWSVDLTDELLAIHPNGLFAEPVTLEVLTATRG